MLIYDDYLTALKKGLSARFDLTENFISGDCIYDLYGMMNIKNSKYVLTQKAKIYGFENNEHLLIRKQDVIDITQLSQELSSLKNRLPDLVKPHGEHMSSQVSLILVTEGVLSEEVAAFAAKFRYQKGFALGFRGWADLNLNVVSLCENRVVTNKKHYKTASFFLPEKNCSKE